MAIRRRIVVDNAKMGQGFLHILNPVLSGSFNLDPAFGHLHSKDDC
jgi:hypothetical protein